MSKSIYAKLIVAFVLVAFLTAALVAVFVRVTSEDRLYRLVVDQQTSTLEQVLASYYSQVGSWYGVEMYWQEMQIVAMNQALPDGDRSPRVTIQRRALFGLADSDGTVLIPVDDNNPAGTTLTQRQIRKGTAVTVNGTQVGTILTAQRLPNYDPAEASFLQRTNQALIYAMLGSLAVALVIGILLARTLTRPIQALTSAAQGIAQGKLEQQVAVSSSDELGQLAQAFNQMSQEVARANMLRRRQTADIAHDLRTPLTVIGGYVESMRDGVLQPTPERLTLMYTEIERLQHLVGDLRMLSQADAGELPLNPQSADPQALLERSAELFQHHAGRQEVTLAVEPSGPLPTIRVDEARLMQVLDNLLSNALRYTPPGGRITLQAQSVSNGRPEVELTVRDTGSGIEPEELTKIFERFHRADVSRHADNGESGLGLAIVKALVEAHGGRVWAESKLGEGTAVHLVFPAGA